MTANTAIPLSQPVQLFPRMHQKQLASRLARLSVPELEQHVVRLHSVLDAVTGQLILQLTGGTAKMHVGLKQTDDRMPTCAFLSGKHPAGQPTAVQKEVRIAVFTASAEAKAALLQAAFPEASSLTAARSLAFEALCLYGLTYSLFSGSAWHLEANSLSPAAKSLAGLASSQAVALEWRINAMEIGSIEELELQLSLAGISCG